MPKGENLTPSDVAIIHDLVLWAQDQDHDAKQQGDNEFLTFLVEHTEVETARAQLDKILAATEDWF